MKLEEAASILGISLEDITIDGLKQAYKRLTINWDPEKCKDQASRNKYQQISEAYRKLNFVVEGSEGYKGDDSHEIAAFMRMFMDMVGISENDHIPAAAAMSFGMMFGSRSDAMDEWSTDEDDDDEDDEDDDDFDDNMIEVEIEDDNEYCRHKNHTTSIPATSSSNSSSSNVKNNNTSKTKTQVIDSSNAWEAPAKQYSNMNLKDEIMNNHKSSYHQSSYPQQHGEDGEQNEETMDVNEIDKEKKLKIAKKRAEKRKKQKEKKLKESDPTTTQQQQSQNNNNNNHNSSNNNHNNSNNSSSNSNNNSSNNHNNKDVINHDNIEKVDPNSVLIQNNIDKEKTKLLIQQLLETANNNPEDLSKLIHLSTKEIISELTTSISNGQLGKVNQILNYHFSDDIPAFITEDVLKLLKQQLPSKPLLHNCVTNFTKINQLSSSTTDTSSMKTLPTSNNHMNSTTYNTAMTATLTARRLEVAKYLINFRNPPLDLSVIDSTGLSVLHLAINYGDLKVAQLIINAFTDGSTERKSQLNINSRCHRQGWAPIHYAVDRGDIESLQLLIQLQGNVLVTMATDKRYTPLEFARAKLKSTNNSLMINNYTIIIDELLKAIDFQKSNKDIDKVKKQSESSSIQDILKELESPVAETKIKKKKSDKKKDKTDTSTSSTTTTSNTSSPSNKATITSANTNAPSSSTSKTSNNEKNKTNSSNSKQPTLVGNNKNTTSSIKPSTTVNATTTTTKSSSNTLPMNQISTEMSIASRDELVDRLLAMGFREADCLVAISLYGTDIDQAISWLCDRPPPPSAFTSKETLKSKSTSESILNNNNNNVNSNNKVHPRSSTSSTNTSLPISQKTNVLPTSTTASISSSEISSSTTVGNLSLSSITNTSITNTSITNAAKMQKEKEELRRINRAWNAKAEDEKRKLEAQRKQLEIKKQEEEVLLKQQQQQQELIHQQQLLQQQYYYQQQYMQQQQHGNTYYTNLHDHEISVDNGVAFAVDSDTITDSPPSIYKRRLNYPSSNLRNSTSDTTTANTTTNTRDIISPSNAYPYMINNNASSLELNTSTGSQLHNNTSSTNTYNQHNNNSSHLINHDKYSNISTSSSTNDSNSVHTSETWSYNNDTYNPYLDNNNITSINQRIIPGMKSNVQYENEFTPIKFHSSTSSSTYNHSTNTSLHTNAAATSLAVVDDNEVLVDGALELSAGAKEFIPRFHLNKPQSSSPSSVLTSCATNNNNNTATSTSSSSSFNNNNNNNNNILPGLHTNPLSNFDLSLPSNPSITASSPSLSSNLYSSSINPPSIPSPIDDINSNIYHNNHSNSTAMMLDPLLSNNNLLMVNSYNHTLSSLNTWDVNNLNLTSLQEDDTSDSIIPPLSLNNFYQTNMINNNNTHISSHILSSNINISSILNDNNININTIINHEQYESDDDNNILSSIDNFLLNDN